MIVVVDNGATVKKFGVNSGSAYAYAEAMARKGHQVWVLNAKAASKCELI